MRERILTGAVGILLMLLALFLPVKEGLFFWLAVVVIAVIGLGEFYQACQKKGALPDTLTGYAAVFIFLLSARYDRSRSVPLAILPAGLTLLILGAMAREVFNPKRRPVLNIGVTAVGAIYSGWLFTYFIHLRSVEGALYPKFVYSLSGGMQNAFAHTGPWLLLFVLLCTWACDSLAYFVGKAAGKIKLAPDLSPGKTVEGAVGGWAGTVLAGLAVGAWIGLPAAHALILAALLGVTGQIGDLAKSAVKRDIGIKDFGVLLPGHGGVLDRFDSLLFNVPVAFYYFMFVVKI
ncbi:MAG: phosphatidate cytidylyltransferase [Armatimonadetes bacterium]|nr:phosphatidate cytidylyltransferase [Armatimonadota bacterium]